MWHRPSNRPIANSNVVTKFNEVVQIDLLFVEDLIILHIIDEAIRFTMCELIPNKQTTTIIDGVTNAWFRHFGPPQLIVSDQEGGLISEDAAIWSERWGTSFKFKPKGSHAAIVERHHQIVRDQIHKLLAQCKLENITVNPSQIISEAVYVKNILTSVHGVSPYVALYGRYPIILKEMEDQGLSQDDDSTGPHNFSTRLREMALVTIVEGISQDRLKRAASSKSRLAGQV